MGSNGASVQIWIVVVGKMCSSTGDGIVRFSWGNKHQEKQKNGVFAIQDAEIGHYVFFMASLIFEARVMASALWACMA